MSPFAPPPLLSYWPVPGASAGPRSSETVLIRSACVAERRHAASPPPTAGTASCPRPIARAAATAARILPPPWPGSDKTGNHMIRSLFALLTAIFPQASKYKHVTAATTLTIHDISSTAGEANSALHALSISLYFQFKFLFTMQSDLTTTMEPDLRFEVLAVFPAVFVLKTFLQFVFTWKRHFLKFL